jgi:hypothetical protein
VHDDEEPTRTPRSLPTMGMCITVEEYDACLPEGITGRIVGHVVHGRIVYDMAGTV